MELEVTKMPEPADEWTLAVQYFILTLQVLVCLTSVYLFSFNQNIAKILSAFAKSKIDERYASAELLEMRAKLNGLRAELSILSPTGQFAAYCRKEREVNKVQDAYDQAKNEHDAKIPSAAKIGAVSQIAVYVVAACLMWLTSHLTFACISSTFFFPFNFVLAFPKIPFVDSNGSCPEGETRVSIFMFLTMAFAVYKCAKARHLQKTE